MATLISKLYERMNGVDLTGVTGARTPQQEGIVIGRLNDEQKRIWIAIRDLSREGSARHRVK